MENKDLQAKAVNIQGKQYVLVVDRIAYFNETYLNGSITTELLSKPEDTTIVIKAIVKPDSEATRSFTGHSQAVVGQGYINKTSALENAETSAVGRALAMMGIGIIESVASADEMAKAGVTTTPAPKTPSAKPPQATVSDGDMTEEEVQAYFDNAPSDAPFPNKPAAKKTLSTTKVIGQPCYVCGAPYVSGVKGPYCKPCYIAWKNNQAK